MQGAQPAFELFPRELVDRFFGLDGKDAFRDGQSHLLFLFAMTVEEEIERSLDLGRDGFLPLALAVELEISAVRDQ